MNLTQRAALRNTIQTATEEGMTMNQIAHAMQDAGIKDIDATTLHNIAATNDDGATERSERTFPTYQSEILERSVIFAIERAGSAYLKQKERARKAQGNAVEQEVMKAKDARQHFINWLGFAPVEWTPEDMVSRFVGDGDPWQVKGQKIHDFAAANGISIELATELQARSITVAQDYIQATRSPRRAGFMAWVESCIQAADDGDSMEPDDLGSVILDAYTRAASYNKPEEGLLIHDFAADQGISDELPTWAEMLQKAMPSEASAARARERIAQRAANLEAAAAEQENELRRRYGEF